MLYPELFRQLESVRWDMDKDIPWDQFDASLLTDAVNAAAAMRARENTARRLHLTMPYFAVGRLLPLGGES